MKCEVCNHIMKEKINSLAVWCFVLGVVNIFLTGGITAIPSIICGHIASKQMKEGKNYTNIGKILNIFGLVISYAFIGIGLGILFFAAFGEINIAKEYLI